MYFRNKSFYMQEQGWEVDLISAQKGKVYIPDLKKYDVVIPEIGFDYFLFSKKKRKKIVDGLVERICNQQYDEIIIESSCLQESTWAEVVSEKCGARHLCYILQEYNPIDSNSEQEFVIFKYLRHELAGITDHSLYDMFLPFWPIKKEQSYSLPAYCNNVVEDIPCDILDHLNLSNYDHVIGCLSRLDKPFIISAIKDIIQYTQSHSKKYLFIMIGGAPEGSSFECNIKKLFVNHNNVELLVTGYMFPVPLSLLNRCEAFITSAGSAWVCMRTGIPTISYDGNDLRPIGIMGRTTKNSLFRSEDEPVQDLFVLLDEILEKKKYPKEEASFNTAKIDFSSHDKFMKEMASSKEFFSFDNKVLSFAERKLSILLRIFGAECYLKLGSLKKKLINSKTSDR